MKVDPELPTQEGQQNQAPQQQPAYSQPQPMYAQQQQQQQQQQPMYAQQQQPMYAQPQYGQQSGYGQQQPMYMQQQPAFTQYSGGGFIDGALVPQGAVAAVNGQMMQVAMSPPPAPAGTPIGLEYFSVLDHIWVKEIPQLLDQFSNVELNQKYQCLNNHGHQVYWAEEKTECCTRQCLKSARPFRIEIFSPSSQLAMVLTRPYRCSTSYCCCFPINCCCLQNMEVSDANGNLIGRVVQRFRLCSPQIDLVDENSMVLLSIQVPYCICGNYGDVDFPLVDPAGHSAGAICKKFGGLMREVFIGNADNFNCSFPMALPIRTKALIFAATFLLDFMYFEDSKKRGSNDRMSN